MGELCAQSVFANGEVVKRALHERPCPDELSFAGRFDDPSGGDKLAKTDTQRDMGKPNIKVPAILSGAEGGLVTTRLYRRHRMGSQEGGHIGVVKTGPLLGSLLGDHSLAALLAYGS